MARFWGALTRLFTNRAQHRTRAHFETFTRPRGVAVSLVLALACQALVSVGIAPAPAHAVSVSTTSCGVFGTGTDLGDIVVKPLHGKAFYVDLKNGINATYVGYEIVNQTGSNLDNIWVQIDDFRAVSGTSVLGLTNPADSAIPVTPSDPSSHPTGRIVSGGSSFVYFLVKASDVSANAQRHDVHIYRGDPRSGGSEYGANYNCYHELSGVKRTLSASANKVTQITADTEAKLGGTITVTVKGATGQSGAGDTSLDADAMWLSPASNADWPTRALRLESVSLVVKYKKNDPSNQWATYNNQLLVKNISCSVSGAGCKSFSSATTYTATYKFRVVGESTTNAEVTPVAQIASGTQMKHTGSYPTTITFVPTSTVSKVVTVSKSLDPSYTITQSGGFFSVRYKVTLTNTDTADAVVDEVLDVPQASVTYFAGSAKVTDKYRMTETSLSPEPIAKDDQGRYHFGGPFTVAAGGTAVVYYVMRIPEPATYPGSSGNVAYGVVGPTLIGADLTTDLVTDCQVVLNADGTTSNSCDRVVAPKQPQTITFPPPPTQGAGTSYLLDATSSSGLPVTYSIVSGPCSLSASTVIYQAQGLCVIQADQAGNDTYSAAASEQQTVTILPQQVITFPQPNSMTTSATQDVTITASSGLKVTLTSLDTNICKVGSTTSTPADTFTPASGASNVFRITSSTSAGNCPLVASQAGDGLTYGAALSVDRTVPVGLSTQVLTTVSPAPASTQSSSTGTVDWRVTPRVGSSSGSLLDLPVTYTSQTPSVCTAGDGARQTSGGSYAYYVATITWTQPGVCIVQADQDGLRTDGTQSAYGAAEPLTISFTIGATPTVTISTVSAVKSAESFDVTVVVAKPASATGAPKGTLSLYTSGDHTSSAVQSGSPLVTNVTGESNKYVFTVSASALPATGESGAISLFATYTSVGAVSGETTYNNSQTINPTAVTVYSPAAVLVSPSKPSVLVNESFTATVTVVGNAAYGTPAGTVTLTTTAGGTITTSMPATLNGSAQVVANVTAGNDPSPDLVFDAAYTPSGESSTYFAPQLNSVTNVSTRTVAIEPRTYTATFNANGGTGVMADQLSNHSAALSANTFTRAGFSFTGWNTAADGSGDAYGDGEVYNFLDNLSLYAQWAPLPVFTVVFDANGGTGAMNDQSAYEATALNSNLYSNYGKTFIGWNTASDGSGLTYNDGAVYPFTADATLYAQWTDRPTYSVTFDSNGGSGSMANQVNFDSAALSANSFVRAGYAFAGWSTQPDGSGTDFSNGATYDFTADVTLYAQWSLLPRFAVTFEANGGSGTMANQTNYATSPLLSNAFTRPGYTFHEWATQPDGSGNTYADGANYSFTADVTLYAQWLPLPYYSVTFDSNLGTGLMDVQTSNFAEALAVNAFTREGYAFTHWNTQADGSGDTYSNGQSYPFTADVTLFAQWEALPTFTVTFVANGGSGSMATQTAYAPEALLANGFLLSGHTFAGWNTQADGNGTPYDDGAVYSFTADVSLFAQWERTVHTISFNANGGDGSMTDQTANSSTAISPNAFVRTGYGFAGWNTQADGGGVAFADGETFDFLDDMTLFAQWNPDDYTVTYDPRGGTVFPSSDSFSVGDTPLTLPNPTRNGYTFAGWSQDELGAFGIVGVAGDGYSPTGNETLYALWTPDNYEVFFDAQGGTVFPLSATYTVDENPVQLPAPSRVGHTFMGWSTDAMGLTGSVGGAADPYTPTAPSTTLYAQWDPDVYVVTFDANGGFVEIPSDSFTYGGQPISLPVATRQYHEFVGWTLNPDNSDPVVGGADDVFEPTDSVTLYAKWQLIEFSVTFDSNNGVGSMADQVGHLPAEISPVIFTRTGYSFGSWNTSPDGSGTSYENGQLVDFTSDLVLYAQWIPDEYLIGFDGQGATTTPDSLNFTVGDDPILLPEVTRIGYSFTGWNVAADGTGQNVGDIADPFAPTESLTLYAQWTPDVYRVMFEPQSGEVDPSFVDFTVGDNPVQLPEPTRAGYTFTGWNTESDGSGTDLGLGGDTMTPTGAVTLYAQWTPNTYRVDFDAQGGTSNPSVDYFTTDSAPINLPTPIRDAWVFNGWNTEPDGSGTTIGVGDDEYSPTSDITLYAQWVEPVFTVVFDPNGGSGSMTPHTSSDAANLRANEFHRTGYSFAGWNTASDGTGTNYADGEEYAFASDITLYAQWEPLQFTVTLDGQGGVVGTTIHTYTYGDDPIILPEPIRNGFAFTGWSMFPSDFGSSFADAGDPFVPEGDVTLYATWTPMVGSQAISGFVWLDLNADGLQDSDEPDLPGLELELVEPDAEELFEMNASATSLTTLRPLSSRVFDSILAMVVTTGSDGSYQLSSLPLGTWVLRALLPEKLEPTLESDEEIGFVTDGEIVFSGANGEMLNSWMGVQGRSAILAPIFGSDGNPTSDHVLLLWEGIDETLESADDVIFDVDPLSGIITLSGLPSGNYRLISVGQTESDSECVDIVLHDYQTFSERVITQKGFNCNPGFLAKTGVGARELGIATWALSAMVLAAMFVRRGRRARRTT